MQDQPSSQSETPLAASQQPVIPNTSAGDDPGKTLSVVALILAFLFSIAGLICGIIANNKSKAAGHSNTLAKVAIGISIFNMVVGLIIGGLIAVGMMAMVNKCQELGPGVHVNGATTIRCGKV